MPMPMSSQIKAGREGVGLFENALSMLTSAAGEPAAGMVALAELIRGGDSGAARDAVRQAFSYQPRTDAGQRQQRMLGELAASAMNSAPVRTWQRGVDIAGRYSPAAGAALQTIPAAIGVAAGAKPAMQQGRALSELAKLAQNRMVQNAMTPGGINTGPIGRQRGVISDGYTDINGLWHGTSGYHTKLNDRYQGSISSGDGRGFWFSKSPEYASEYAQNASGKTGLPMRLAPSKVRAKNVFVYDVIENKLNAKSNSDVIDYALKNGYDAIDWSNGSFTDDPSVTVFDSDNTFLLDKADVANDIIDSLKYEDGLTSFPESASSFGIQKPKIKKDENGFSYELNGYLYDEFDSSEEAMLDYVIRALTEEAGNK